MNIFIDIDPDTALERIAKSRFQRELFEEKSRLTIVRQKYIEAFDKLQGVEQVAVVDGNGSPKEIAADVWDIVKKCFIMG